MPLLALLAGLVPLLSKIASRSLPTLAVLGALTAAFVAMGAALSTAKILFAGIDAGIWCWLSWVGLPQALAAFLGGIGVAVAYVASTSASKALAGLTK